MRILLGLFMLGVTSIAYSQAPQQPFTITISADKPQVKAGDDVYLNVTMTNASDHDEDCTRNWSNALDRNYNYDVNDEYGQVPKIEKKYHGGSRLSPCIIKPGETAKSGGLISVLYDFSRPGKYTIQVSRAIWGDDQRPEPSGTVQTSQPDVRSNIITITVLPADEPPPAKQ